MLVVKLGGALGNEAEPVLRALPAHRPCLLVHGGSAEADRLSEALGRPARFLASPTGVVSRYTDAEHLDHVTMAIAGRANTALVARLQRSGVPAVGLSGVDGGLVRARRKEAVRAVLDGRTVHVRDDLSGAIESVNAALLGTLVDAGYVPVVSPPALAADGAVVNVDADRLAARVAVAVHADALLLLTNVPGLLRRVDEPSSLVAEVPSARFEEFLSLAQGRMKKKLLAAHEAAAGGVPRAVIGASQGPDPIGAALGGAGTVVA